MLWTYPVIIPIDLLPDEFTKDGIALYGWQRVRFETGVGHQTVQRHSQRASAVSTKRLSHLSGWQKALSPGEPCYPWQGLMTSWPRTSPRPIRTKASGTDERGRTASRSGVIRRSTANSAARLVKAWPEGTNSMPIERFLEYSFPLARRFSGKVCLSHDALANTRKTRPPDRPTTRTQRPCDASVPDEQRGGQSVRDTRCGEQTLVGVPVGQPQWLPDSANQRRIDRGQRRELFSVVSSGLAFSCGPDGNPARHGWSNGAANRSASVQQTNWSGETLRAL